MLEPPAHNTGCCVIGLTYSSGTFVSFFVFSAGCKASGPSGPPLQPPWNPWNIQLSQGTGQGVSMTFNAASRLRSLEDRSAALGSRRCELPGMHSVPTSAVLPYASGVGGLSRRLLNYINRNLREPAGIGALRAPRVAAAGTPAVATVIVVELVEDLQGPKRPHKHMDPTNHDF